MKLLTTLTYLIIAVTPLDLKAEVPSTKGTGIDTPEEASAFRSAISAVNLADVSATGGLNKIPKTDGNGRLTLSVGSDPAVWADGFFGKALQAKNGPIFSFRADGETVRMRDTVTDVLLFNSVAKEMNDSVGVVSLNWGDRVAYDASAETSVHWGDRMLYATGGKLVLDWNNSRTFDNTDTQSIDWEIRALSNSSGAQSILWGDYLMLDQDGGIAVNWSNARQLVDALNVPTADWGNRLLIDRLEQTSVDWENRSLKDWGGANSVDWGTHILYGAGGNIAINWSDENNVVLDAQTSTPSDYGAVMTLQATDIYYGRKYGIVTASLTSSSSTTFATAGTVTLPAGTYTFNGAINGYTASSTAGILVEVAGSGTNLNGTALRGTAATEAAASVVPTIYNKYSGVNFADIATATVAGGASGKQAFTTFSGSLKITSLTTYTIRVKQLVTDAANPTFCGIGSYVTFTKN